MASGYRSRDAAPMYQRTSGPTASVSGSSVADPGYGGPSVSGPSYVGPCIAGPGYGERVEYDDIIAGARGRIGGARAAWERQCTGSEEGPTTNRQRSTSWRVEEDAQEGRVPERGAVNKARMEWRVHEDSDLARRLQEQENMQHYGHNRSERSVVRSDIINARIVQHEEELRLQEEKMKEIEEKQRIAERDAAYVQRMLSEEEDEEDRLKRIAEEDEKLARRLMREVNLEEETALRIQQEHDERVAMELQKREERRYERYKEKKRERELDRTRKQLEKEIEEQRQQILSPGENNGSKTQKRLSSEGVVEDTDFTDFYKVDPEMDEATAREDQERQDAELARLLQDQEHKRGGKPNRNKLKTIEERDAELAKVIQEQENFRAEKIEKRMKRLRQIKTQEQIEQGASSALSVDTHDVTTVSSTSGASPRLPVPHYPSPPNYEQAVSRSRENLSQSPGRYALRDSPGPSPPAYRSPPMGRPLPSSSYHNQSAESYELRGSHDHSPSRYHNTSRYSESTTPTQSQYDGGQGGQGRFLNRSFERQRDETRLVQPKRCSPSVPRDEYGGIEATRAPSTRSRDDMGQSARPKNNQSQPELKNSSYPLNSLSDQYGNFKSSQSAHTIQGTHDTRTDQSSLRTSQTMQNVSSRDKPVSQSRSIPVREELRRAVDPHEDSDSDDAGFQNQGQAKVQGHPNSRSANGRPHSTLAGSFNIVEALDPTFRPTTTNRSSVYSSTNRAPGENCHQYLRNQYSTLEYGEPAAGVYRYRSDDDGEEDDDWMPVQGQRRQSDGKCVGKKKTVSAAAGDKDKCKQQ